MKLFLSPHNDDETLFGAFTLMRERPLVVICTDSYIQSNRGENITADQRWDETMRAMEVLGCPVMRLGIRDDVVDEYLLMKRLTMFGEVNIDCVYAPAKQGGNPLHDLVSEVSLKAFPDVPVLQYTTYAKGQWYTEGTAKVEPVADEMQRKLRAMNCYFSQHQLPATMQHFQQAARRKTEWFI